MTFRIARGLLLIAVLLLAIAVTPLHAETGDHPAVSLLPFLLLLAAIAILPLLAEQWWKRSYVWVAAAFVLAGGALQIARGESAGLLHGLREYFSFIVLIGSLYVVAGGLYIDIRGRATPLANTLFLFTGGVLANIIGTTGASMVFIRPYLRSNRGRLRPFHVVFFIFLIGNIGGALTPIGDPPLFLGYLKGIPFFWVMANVWFIWLPAVAVLLALFYIFDHIQFRRQAEEERAPAVRFQEKLHIEGAHNLLFMAFIVAACFLQNIPFLREAMMLAAAVGSYITSSSRLHGKNEFTFHPVREVAVLFLAIFVTMVPALVWLERNAASFGVDSAGQLYWGTGVLSSVLDNAPTYLSFLSAAIGRFTDETIVGTIHQVLGAVGPHAAQAGSVQPEVAATIDCLVRNHGQLVAAGTLRLEYVQTAWLIVNHGLVVASVSVAAVFFGAMTYIGNGPNLMIKAIAENAGLRMPGFFGYVFKYSLPILLPLFLLVWLIFFR